MENLKSNFIEYVKGASRQDFEEIKPPKKGLMNQIKKTPKKFNFQTIIRDLKQQYLPPPDPLPVKEDSNMGFITDVVGKIFKDSVTRQIEYKEKVRNNANKIQDDMEYFSSNIVTVQPTETDLEIERMLKEVNTPEENRQGSTVTSTDTYEVPPLNLDSTSKENLDMPVEEKEKILPIKFINYAVSFFEEFEGNLGGDNVTGKETLPYGILKKTAIRKNIIKKDVETDLEYAIRFYDTLEKEMIKKYFSSEKGISYDDFSRNEKVSILSTYANNGSFARMPKYEKALLKGDRAEMGRQLLDVISVTEPGAKVKTTSSGLAVRRAAEYNLLNPKSKQIAFVKMVGDNNKFNTPVTYEYRDKDNNIMFSFRPSQRLISTSSVPKDGSSTKVYSVLNKYNDFIERNI